MYNWNLQVDISINTFGGSFLYLISKRNAMAFLRTRSLKVASFAFFLKIRT